MNLVCLASVRMQWRSLLILPALGLSWIAAASNSPDSGTFTASKVYWTSKPVVDSARDFFPQITNIIAQKPLRPENPRHPFEPPKGPLNNLKVESSQGYSPITPGAGYNGIGHTGWMPPDCKMAAGPNHLVEMVNCDLAFFKKSNGQKLFQQGFGTFFASLNPTSFLFDPKVHYDALSGRFFVVCLEEQGSPTVSKVIIGVSATNDPTGTWYKYRIEAKRTVDSNEYWMDYPCVGFNKDTMIVSGNMFPFSSGGFFVQMLVIRKAELLTGSAAHVVAIDANNTGTIQPAYSLDTTNTAMFGTSSGSDTQIFLWMIKGGTTDTPTASYKLINIPPFTYASGAASCKGGGSIDTLSDRYLDSVLRAGKLYTCRTIGTSDGRTQAAAYQFDVSTWATGGNPSYKQILLAETPAPTNTLMPSISVNKFGDVTMIYTRCSSTITADVMVTGHKNTEANGVIGPGKVLSSSLGICEYTGSRWGDFFAACVDPVDDTTFWGVGETIVKDGTDSGAWGTYLASWIVSPPHTYNDYVPGSVTKILGGTAVGGLADVVAQDSKYFSISSGLDSLLGQVAGAKTTFTAAETRSTIAGLTIKSVANVPTQLNTVTYMLFVYNFTTKAWDQFVSNRVVPGSDFTSTVNITTNVLNYVGPSGEVWVVGRCHNPFSRIGSAPQPFLFKTNYVQVTVDSVQP